jgi:diguanylate cyclase (GGDEF)-like protein
MTFIGKIGRPEAIDMQEDSVPDLEQRIDELLRVKLRNLKIPRDIKPLFDRRLRGNLRKSTAAWCFWVAVLVLVNTAFDVLMLPANLLPLVFLFRITLGGSLGAAGWLFQHDILRRFAPFYIGLPCVLAVTFAGTAGLLAHEPDLLARYMNDALIVVASAIMFVGLDMSFALTLGAICLPLMAGFLLAAHLHPAAAGPQEIFFDSCTIGALIYGRHMQSLVLSRMFLLNMRDELRNSDAKARHAQLSSIAYTDPLTEIANRRYFDEICAKLDDTTPGLLPVSICMIDIDHFKSLNDRLGHLQGDRCLKLIAATIRNNLRSRSDILARFGGEEFVLLLPATDIDTAYEIAERIRAAIVDLAHAHPGSPIGVVTASMGVSEQQKGPLNLQTLLQNADHALYRAKITGRNRVST